VLDDSLLAEVHPTPGIYRVSTVILHDVLPRFAARLRGRSRRAPAGMPAGPGPPAAEGGRRSDRGARRSLSQAIYRWFAISTYFPDHLFLWGWSAALKSLALHLRRRYEVIYTTSYPESAHLAGLVLAMCGVKWVADYRYGGPMWIKDVVGFEKPRLRERLDHLYQRCVLRKADCVIAQSDRLRDDFCRVFDLDPDRVIVIPSGYDEADFELPSATPAPFSKAESDLHLLHVGTLEGVGEHERTLILEALNELSTALRDRGCSLVVHAVGSDLFRPDQSAAIRFPYRHYGVVLHREVPSYLRAADCYLLSTMTTSHGDVKGFIPSKLWEYLRAGRPVMTVGPKDEVWRILEEAGVGLHVTLNGDRAASAEGLADRLLHRVRTQKPLHSSVRRYSWESRARTLQSVFHRLVHVAPEGRGGEAVA
jgi:glycosyltransferase involved in cell wall biosynthesis